MNRRNGKARTVMVIIIAAVLFIAATLMLTVAVRQHSLALSSHAASSAGSSSLVINSYGSDMSDYLLLGCIFISAASLGLIILLTALLIMGRRRERQLGLYRITESCGVFSVRADDKLTLVYANDKFYQIVCGVKETAKERHDGKFAEYFHPEDLAAIKKELSSVVESGDKYVQRVIRTVTKCGDPRYMLVNGVIRKRKRYTVVDGVATDITKQKKAELDLRVQQEITDVALLDSSLNIREYDFKTKTLFQTDKSKCGHGLCRRADNVPESLIDSGLVHTDSVFEMVKLYDSLRSGAKKADGIFRVRDGDNGNWRYEHIYYTNLFDDGGSPYKAVGYSEDITVQHELALAYQRETSFRKVMEQQANAAFFINVTKNEGTGSENGSATVEDVFRSLAESVVENEDIMRYFESMNRERLLERADKQQDEVSFNFLRKSGASTLWVHYEEHLLRDPENSDVIAYLYMTDIDEQKKKELELEAAAQRDSMTGLLNHSSTISQISRFLRMEGSAGTHALFIIDVDNFKSINDTYGHQYGDAVLMDVARTIQNVFRASDVLGRIGGDEFMLLMKNVGSERPVWRKAGELVHALQFSCGTAARETHISASVGIAICGSDGSEFEEIYSRADAALYKAKSKGKNRFYLAGRKSDLERGSPSVSISGTETVQLRTLLEYMDAGVVLYEVEDDIKINYISPSFFKSLCGFSEGPENYENNIFSSVLPEDLPALRKSMIDSAKSKTALDSIYRVYCADGSVGWRRLRGGGMPSEGAGPLRIIGVISDVTELKRKNAQLEAIVKNSPIGIGMFACLNGGVSPLMTNHALEDMFGLKSPGAPGGMPFEAQCGELDQLLKKMAASCKDGRPLDLTYSCLIRSQNRIMALLARGVRLYEGEGKPVLLLMLTDITDRKRMEAELGFSKARCRAVIDLIGAAVLEADLERRIVRLICEGPYKLNLDAEYQNAPESILESGMLHPESKAAVSCMFFDMSSGTEGKSYSFLLENRAGDCLSCTARFSLLENGGGARRYAVIVLDPVTRVKVPGDPEEVH